MTMMMMMKALMTMKHQALIHDFKHGGWKKGVGKKHKQDTTFKQKDDDIHEYLNNLLTKKEANSKSRESRIKFSLYA
jgi:hypothetical protein